MIRGNKAVNVVERRVAYLTELIKKHEGEGKPTRYECAERAALREVLSRAKAFAWVTEHFPKIAESASDAVAGERIDKS